MAGTTFPRARIARHWAARRRRDDHPTIFASVLENGDRYNGQLRDLPELGASTETAIFTVTTDDVRAAREVLAPVYQQQLPATRGSPSRPLPGWPRHAAATADMARALRSAVDRDNMFVKIPATPEGLSAITQVTSEGISVDVTLIFAVAQYHAVMDAYLSGLEQAADAGRDPAATRSGPPPASRTPPIPTPCT